MTYLQLFNFLKQLNNNKYLDQILYEFIFDKNVYDKITFIKNKDMVCKSYKRKIFLFKKVINKNIPWERVLKYTYFYSLKIKLFNKVFSPRQDTEILVYYVLEYLNQNKNKNINVFDLGTGTGCICCALNKNTNHNVKIFGFENNIKAFFNTLINKKNLKCNFKVIKKNYLKLMHKNKFNNFDVLVCNPPYIDFNETLDQNVIKYDPKTALYAKNNGFFYYDEILKFLSKQNNRICVFFEIGYNQKEGLLFLLNKYNFKNFDFFKDLNNNDRVLRIYHNF